jgi:hypothetical protein
MHAPWRAVPIIAVFVVAAATTIAVLLLLLLQVFWGGDGPNDKGLSRKHIIEGTKVLLLLLLLLPHQYHIDTLECT